MQMSIVKTHQRHLSAYKSAVSEFYCWTLKICCAVQVDMYKKIFYWLCLLCCQHEDGIRTPCKL